jgi:hypothetical protein
MGFSHHSISKVVAFIEPRRELEYKREKPTGSYREYPFFSFIASVEKQGLGYTRLNLAINNSLEGCPEIGRRKSNACFQVTVIKLGQPTVTDQHFGVTLVISEN